jgi:hypothetical protein
MAELYFWGKCRLLPVEDRGYLQMPVRERVGGMVEKAKRKGRKARMKRAERLLKKSYPGNSGLLCARSLAPRTEPHACSCAVSPGSVSGLGRTFLCQVSLDPGNEFFINVRIKTSAET